MPLQYSCLENPIDRGAWRATVHGVAQSRLDMTAAAEHAHTRMLVRTANRGMRLKPHHFNLNSYNLKKIIWVQ